MSEKGPTVEQITEALLAEQAKTKNLNDRLLQLQAEVEEAKKKEASDLQVASEHDKKRAAETQELLVRLSRLEAHLGDATDLRQGQDALMSDDEEEQPTILDDSFVFSPEAWFTLAGNLAGIQQWKDKVGKIVGTSVTNRDRHELESSMDGIGRFLASPGVEAALLAAPASHLAWFQATADRWFKMLTISTEGIEAALREEKLLPGHVHALPTRYRRARLQANLGRAPGNHKKALEPSSKGA